MALAVSNVNAAVIGDIETGNPTVLVQILNGMTDESMLIDTKVLSSDFRSGAMTSWAANTDLKAAIDTFMGAAADVPTTDPMHWTHGVKYYAFSYDKVGVGFDKYALANKTQLSEIAVDAMNGDFQVFTNNANSGVFTDATEGLTENWFIGIPEFDNSHYTNPMMNSYVQGFDLGVTAPFFASHSKLLGGATNITLLDWNLAADGSLTYGAVIPVPAAVWLFGSGLLGLVGIARRRKA